MLSLSHFLHWEQVRLFTLLYQNHLQFHFVLNNYKSYNNLVKNNHNWVYHYLIKIASSVLLMSILDDTMAYETNVLYSTFIYFVGAMDKDPAKMAAILIEAISEFCKQANPQHIRLVQVIVYDKNAGIIDHYLKEMKEASNISQFSWLYFIIFYFQNML